jgi:hypothetical protein
MSGRCAGRLALTKVIDKRTAAIDRRIMAWVGPL